MKPMPSLDPKTPSIPERSPIEFWDNVVSKTESSRTLLEATMELTYGCNLRCVHCYNPTHRAKKEEMPTEKIISIFKELRTEGCLSLTLTGGEMFTRRDFLDILTRAKEEGFAVTLKTNGTFLTEEIADCLQSLLPLEVDLSLYGATRKIYERVTSVPGSFSKCISGIERLIKKKIPVTLIIPAMTVNVEEVERMQAMAKGWGIRAVTSTVIHPKSDGSLEPLVYRLDPDKAAQLLQDPLPLVYHKPLEKGEEGPRRWKGRMNCRAAQNSCAITPYGEMNFCVSFPFPKYNLMKGTVHEGWRTLLDWFDAYAKKEPSDGKSLHPLYRGCPRDGWGEADNFDAPVPYYEALALAEERLRRPAP
ncbi:MAG: radical SAM protein [Candidatus Omnitrophica bacterium]|nr:radical SAM protein [Candidatus Omnitrophota bacterium]